MKADGVRKIFSKVLVSVIILILVGTAFSTVVMGLSTETIGYESSKENTIGDTDTDIEDSGATDDWGYKWTNSVGSPSVDYQWYEVSGADTWTWLESDGWTDKIDIGFNFTFYGKDYESFYIMADGWISPTDVAGYQGTGISFPGNEHFNTVISPYSADLNRSFGQIYYKTIQEGLNDLFIVTWENVTHEGTPSENQTFQLVLNETGDIRFNYKSLNVPSANVGIENHNSTIGLDYDDVSSLSSELSIKFEYVPYNYQMSVQDTLLAGQGSSGETLWYNTTLNNYGSMGDTYNVNVVNSWTTRVYDETDTDITSGSVSLASGESEKISIKVTVGGTSPGDYDKADIEFSSVNDASLKETVSVVSQIPGDVMLVDDDFGITTEDYHMEALEDYGYTYGYWDRTWGSPGPNQIVIWFTGNTFGGSTPTLDGTDRANVGEFLDNGGSMYLTSQGCNYDSFSSSWKTWFMEYFYSYTTALGSGEVHLLGVQDDPITGYMNTGRNKLYTGDSHPSLSSFTEPFNQVQGSEVIYTNNDRTQNLTLRAEDGESKIVFSSFNFAGIHNGTYGNRTILMHRIVKWLDHVPNKPADPKPASGSKGASLNPQLEVTVSDPDGQYMDVMFYNETNSLIGIDHDVPSGAVASVVYPGLERDKMYEWYAVASDGIKSNRSYKFNFTTNLIPDKPSSPSPEDNVTRIDINANISVEVNDPEGLPLDVHFYNNETDTLIGTDEDVPSGERGNITWKNLKENKRYGWYAVADDGADTATSRVWNFTTDKYPDKPVLIEPAHTSVNNSLKTTLKVHLYDGNGENMTVSLYDAKDVGNLSDDELIGEFEEVTPGSNVSLLWTGLEENTTYYWYAVADDGVGQNSSIIWNFETTRKPNKPINPNPSHSSIDESSTITLQVDVTDPDGDKMDVMFYDASDDSKIGTDYDVSSGSTASFVWDAPDGEDLSWYAVAKDENLATNTSDIWDFSTNAAPDLSKANPSPGDESIGVPIDPELEVSIWDSDSDNLTVKFYNASNDAMIGQVNDVSSGERVSVTWADLNRNHTYSWYVTADDGEGTTQSLQQSLTWQFKVNNKPEKPFNPRPKNGASNLKKNITMSVEVIDPDGTPMDVYFYNADTDEEFGNVSVYSGNVAELELVNLSLSTTYHWYAVADDGADNTTSDTWNFTTKVIEPNRAPDAPSSPSPSDGATDVSTSPTISVDVSDTDGDSMDVTFYDSSDDSEIGKDTGVSSGSSASVIWSALTENTTYEWYTVVDDGEYTTTSSTWSFTTEEETITPNTAPDTPSTPIPSDGETDVATSVTLTVAISDPDGDSMDVTFYDASDDSEIGSDTDVSSGSSVSVTWSSLSMGTNYEWYAVADDGEYTTTSSTWSFTTEEEQDDIEPPELIEVIPEDGATDVDISKGIEFVFDEEIGEYDITISSADGEVQGEWSTSNDGKTLIFTPDSDFKYGTTYTIDGTAEDTNGNVLDPSEGTSFTTEKSTSSSSDDGINGILYAGIGVLILVILLILYFMKGRPSGTENEPEEEPDKSSIADIFDEEEETFEADETAESDQEDMFEEAEETSEEELFEESEEDELFEESEEDELFEESEEEDLFAEE